MKIDTPCTDVCQFDPRNKWCVGCGRTPDEIKAWRKLTPFRRTVLTNELKHRMRRLRRNGHAVESSDIE
ncbi:DUF1289 domain-containing protein [Neorhizobium sp. NPDC001467]|uniref:DUF1289 domain-containing protein n=1 Tax=Neorhizobium sp. NPDC001467 TaxID=3390595 RepID=UPI003CFD26E2